MAHWIGLRDYLNDNDIDIIIRRYNDEDMDTHLYEIKICKRDEQYEKCMTFVLNYDTIRELLFNLKKTFGV